MPEQSQSNADAAECNVNNYPYVAIRLPLKELLLRFGNKDAMGEAYFPLVIDWGFKGPFWTNWSTRTWEEVIKEELCDKKGGIHVPAGQYLNLLASGKRNVGIKLGPAWGRLGNFDIDISDRRIIDTLLKFCPKLADTLWTKGSNQSGHSSWFIMEGEWPGWIFGQGPGIRVPDIMGRPKKDRNTGEFKENPSALEFRVSNGLQSVIYGLHENKTDHYCVVNDRPVVAFEWSEIKKLIDETTALGWTGWPQPASGRAPRSEGRWTNNPLGWKGDLETRVRLIEELGYEILDIEESGRNRIKVRCPNVENHNTPEKEGEAVIFPGTDPRGEVAFCCLHATCKTKDDALGSSFNQRETQKLHQAIAQAEAIYYRQGGAQIHETYAKAYQLMSAAGEFYNLNKSVVRWQNGWEEVLSMNSARIQPSLNELGIRIVHHLKGGNKIGPMRLAGSEADNLLDQPTYVSNYLPKIRAVAPCALYYTKDGKTGQLTQYGYNRDIEYLNLHGQTIELMPLEAAVKFLHEFFLQFFEFETPSDYSRAFAALISPALLLGRWFEGRSPAFLVVADKRQAGKTFFLKLLAAIYNHDLILQEYLERAIGGVIERLWAELGRGVPFFAIDNIRGAPDLPFIEIFTTGGKEVQFRGAYEKMRYADTTTMTLLLCGNEGFKISGDLASRCIIPKLLYKANRTWRLEDGLSLAKKVQTLWPQYLGAICGIIASWAGEGAKRLSLPPEELEADLRFIDWHECQSQIGQMVGLAPLNQGLGDRQKRASDNSYVFSDVAFGVLEQKGFLDKMATPTWWGDLLENSDCQLPFKYKSRQSLAIQMGNLLSKLPTVREGINRFGTGFVYLWKDPSANRMLYAFSKNENLNPALLPIYEPED